MYANCSVVDISPPPPKKKKKRRKKKKKVKQLPGTLFSFYSFLTSLLLSQVHYVLARIGLFMHLTDIPLFRKFPEIRKFQIERTSGK